MKNMMNKDEFRNLGEPVKANGRSQKTRRTHPVVGARSTKWRTRTPADGKPTFWGVYCALLRSIQNDRGWVKPTCRRYDDAVCETLARAFQEDDIPFSSLMEEDIVERWERTLDGITSQSLAQSCFVMLRLIMQAAYDAGYTTTLLWGMPSNVPTTGEAEDRKRRGKITKEEADELEGKRLAKKLLGNSFCIPMEKEYELYLLFQRMCDRHGEYLLGMILMEAMCRTSEGTALTYDDLVKIGSVWTLRIMSSSDKDSRTKNIGGKTKNMYRYVPISTYLARFLLERRKSIETSLGGKRAVEIVKNYPIACFGKEYYKPCKQREGNRAIKDAFKRCGVEEGVVSSAYSAVRDDREISDQCEGFATAYIFRHQGATEMQACGCSQTDIYAMLGHKMDTWNADKADYANPDKLRELAAKLARRPLRQILDGNPAHEELTLSAEARTLFAKESVTVHVSAGQTFLIAVNARETGDTLHVDMPNDAGAVRCDAPRPQERADSELYMASRLRLCAEACREVARKKLAAESAVSAADDENWLNSTGTLTAVRLAESKTESNVAAEETPNVSALPAKSAVMQPAAQSAPCPVTANGVAAIVTSDRGVVPVPEGVMTIGSFATAGRKVVDLGRKDRITGAFSHDADADALLLAPDGTAYHIPAGTALERHSDVLKDGGILLPFDLANTAGSELLLASRNGRLRRVPADTVSKVTQSGTSFARLDPASDERLAAACFCPHGSDLLLIGSDGQALRLYESDAVRPDARQNKAMRAMSLHTGAHIVACLPYSETTALLCASAGGNILLTQPGGLPAQHGGAQGVRLMKLEGSDTVAAAIPPAEAFLLVRSDGSVLCLDAAEITPLNRNSKGRRGMRLRSGQSIVGLLSLTKSPVVSVAA